MCTREVKQIDDAGAAARQFPKKKGSHLKKARFMYSIKIRSELIAKSCTIRFKM